MGQRECITAKCLRVEGNAKRQITALFADHTQHFLHPDIGDLYRGLWVGFPKLRQCIKQKCIAKHRLRCDHEMPNLTARDGVGLLLQIAKPGQMTHHSLMKPKGLCRRSEPVSLALEQFESCFFL